MFSALTNEFKKTKSHIWQRATIWGTGFHTCGNVKVLRQTWKCSLWRRPEGPGRSSGSPSILSLPGLILLIVRTGLDVSRQLYLHISKQGNHLQLLQSHNERKRASQWTSPEDQQQQGDNGSRQLLALHASSQLGLNMAAKHSVWEHL